VTALTFRAGVASDTGRVRAHNEDAWLVLPDVDPLLLVVADGMGGHRAGDVASRLTVEEMAAAFAGWSANRRWTLRRAESPRGRLVEAVRRANARVLAEARRDESRRGMGTTVVALLLDGDVVHFAHVGDSRLYRSRAGRLEQLTADHSLLNEYLQLGLITPERAAAFPYKNVIVRAVGLSPGVEVDAATREAVPGDRFLLCSDGLTDLVPDETIRDQLATGDDPAATAQALVDLALDAGGTDNVTAVVAHTHAEGS
jgi:protein phosphatase